MPGRAGGKACGCPRVGLSERLGSSVLVLASFRLKWLLESCHMDGFVRAGCPVLCH